MGAKRRREIVGRKAPAGRAVVAVAPERLLCAVRSERIEANRVREGKDGDFGAVFRQAPSVIDMLITAIRAGELDQQLAQTSKQATPKSKAA